MTFPVNSIVGDHDPSRAFANLAAPESVGRFVAGTTGDIAPEQVLDPMELDRRADVFALAATLYNVTAGRSFFDELTSTRERIIAHMKRDPLDDPERVKGFPAGITKLLRTATSRDPKDRPYPAEFGKEFAALL